MIGISQVIESIISGWPVSGTVLIAAGASWPAYGVFRRDHDHAGVADAEASVEAVRAVAGGAEWADWSAW